MTPEQAQTDLDGEPADRVRCSACKSVELVDDFDGMGADLDNSYGFCPNCGSHVPTYPTIEPDGPGLFDEVQI